MSTSRRSSKTPTAFPVVRLPIDKVVPYWRNPRTISEEAVNAVAESIRRYGYSQPIVVDAQHVIIIGHTRYSALRRLGVTDVDVRVETGLKPEQIKQLRVIDNRVAEFTTWDYDALVAELGDLDRSLAQSFFPTVGDVSDDGPDADSVTVTEEPDPWAGVDLDAEFVCPSCFHSWEMRVDRKQVLAGRLEVKA